MIWNVLVRAALAGALVISIPAAAVAQAEMDTPEGIEWHLVWYPSGSDLEEVPWFVDATLTLEDGIATGTAGCNEFSVPYQIDRDGIAFSQAISITEMACDEPGMAVESGYMAALRDSAEWSIDASLAGNDAALTLYDTSGDSQLVFALPVVGLTQADMVSLHTQLSTQQAKIERLDERLDNVKIGILRDRLKALETEVQQLRSQAASSGSDRSAFNAAEKVLLEGIPAKIRQTCAPRRDQNPAGTVAAVQCSPETSAVRDMAYYLMEADDATKVWEQRMNQHGVKDGPGTCRKGKKDAVFYTGGLEMDGCYVNADGRANLRYVADAAACHQLKAGSKHLKAPALYIAVLGHDNDLAKLTKWAESTPSSGSRDLRKDIERPNEPWSNLCPH